MKIKNQYGCDETEVANYTSHMITGMVEVNGDIWRMLLSRCQKITPSGQEVQPHPAWSMNKHGVYDTHIPECFSKIHSSTEVIK